MPYTPRQAPGNLPDFDALRQWVEDEFMALASQWADDDLSSDTSLASIQSDITALQSDVTAAQGDITTLQGDVTTLQGDVIALQGKIAQADDVVANSASIALTTGTAANITSVSLPTGTWDLDAMLVFSGAGVTNTTNVLGSINNVSPTITLALPQGATFRASAGMVDLIFPMKLGSWRVVVPSGPNVTYYLNAQAAFTVSTYGVTGLLQARRVIV